MSSSAWTWVASLLVLLVSLAAWCFLQQQQTSSESATSSAAKRRKRKKAAKAKDAERSKMLIQDYQGSAKLASDAATKTPATADAAGGSDDEDDSEDEDAGLSAMQVLAKRRFQPTALGGASAQETTVAPFSVQERVLARFEGGSEWFPAVIQEVRRGRTYTIKYDDGAVEHNVPHALIRVRPDSTAYASGAASSPQLKAEVVPVASVAEKRQQAPSDGSVEDDSSSEEESADQEEEEWQFVGATPKTKRSGRAAAAPAADILIDGLTKKQRENRRKKERQRELKELARAQAQPQGLHARWGGTNNKYKYVPPPPQPKQA